MTSLRDLSQRAQELGLPGTAWRDELLPARFRNALFHVETGSKENGRRIVVHQFPKKDVPYSEDMGREAKAFSVRGYCICFPYDTDVPLYMRDYRVARDILIEELEKMGPGVLQLPTFKKTPLYVVCSRYRVTEEERFGGFCIFDMQFVEFGFAPSRTQPIDPTEQLKQESQKFRQTVIQTLNKPPPNRVDVPPQRITRPVVF
jgi:prophage DNA circulation protein